jgi:P27 family predicted phage terminase small subunit
MSLAAKKRWNEVASQMSDAGLLSFLDEYALEQYCSIYARWAEAQKDLAKNGIIIKGSRGGVKENPWLAISEKCERSMRAYLDRFGLTPASRAKLKVEDADDDEGGKWAGLVGG